MKHMTFLIAIIIACLIVAAAHFVYISTNTQHNAKEYLSFTTSQSLGSDKLEATVYEYNLQNNKIS